MVVGIYDDKSVRKMKGENRPVNNEDQRAKFISALRSVDFVVSIDEISPMKILSIIKPQRYIKTGYYPTDDLRESRTLKKIGCEIIIVKFNHSLSTSSLIQKILSSENDIGNQKNCDQSLNLPDFIFGFSNFIRHFAYRSTHQIQLAANILSKQINDKKRILIISDDWTNQLIVNYLYGTINQLIHKNDLKKVHINKKISQKCNQENNENQIIIASFKDLEVSFKPDDLVFFFLHDSTQQKYYYKNINTILQKKIRTIIYTNETKNPLFKQNENLVFISFIEGTYPYYLPGAIFIISAIEKLIA